MRKKKFNSVNFIPNQSNYQREKLLKNSKKHINKK